ncbi:hypothetical protein QR680_017314 [Steinernema hermaphroditum]|uniref:SSD domain-containing protein n=1 Tax=Steinernema hermaphroditum TaxID=289476 RepID=A0AA39HGA1_9BILA|nr:hypothetical protein QR680_017314 [Steinernema hermaphroditum]
MNSARPPKSWEARPEREGARALEVCVSTILCVLSFLCVSLCMSFVFAKAMFLCISLGLLHGFILIPVVFLILWT